jgi:ABC-type multidrug transport system ATPase subunit
MVEKNLLFEAKELSIKLGQKNIFQNISLVANSPTIILIEGENGAGKTSLLKVLAGQLNPDKGSVLYNSKNPIASPVGHYSFFLATSMGLEPAWSGLEHIKIFQQYLNVSDSIVNQSLEKFRELEIFNEILVKKVETFSQGMKQILRLFLHMFFVPELLFLDEPFQFLSPKAKVFFWNYIRAISQHSFVFITDQSFNWIENKNYHLISLDKK